MAELQVWIGNRPRFAFAAIAALLMIGPGLSEASAQDYERALVTYVDGSSDSVAVRLDGYRQLGRELFVRDAQGARALPASEVAAVAGTQLRLVQVARPYTNNAGDPIPARRLARQLLRGPVSLYRLDLAPVEKHATALGVGTRVYTYFLIRDGEAVELEQVETDRGTTVAVRDLYLGVLKYYMRDCEEATSLLGAKPPGYNDRDLTRVVERYNACLGGASQRVTDKHARVRFGGVWLQGGAIRLVHLPPEASGVHPAGGFSLELRAGRQGSRRLGAELGVELYSRTFDLPAERDSCYLAGPGNAVPNTTRCRTVPISDQTPQVIGVRVPLMLTYELVDPERALRPYAGMGIAGIWERGTSEPRRTSVAPLATLGLRSRRFRVCFKGDVDGRFSASVGWRVLGSPRRK